MSLQHHQSGQNHSHKFIQPYKKSSYLLKNSFQNPLSSISNSAQKNPISQQKQRHSYLDTLSKSNSQCPQQLEKQLQIKQCKLPIQSQNSILTSNNNNNNKDFSLLQQQQQQQYFQEQQQNQIRQKLFLSQSKLSNISVQTQKHFIRNKLINSSNNNNNNSKSNNNNINNESSQELSNFNKKIYNQNCELQKHKLFSKQRDISAKEKRSLSHKLFSSKISEKNARSNNNSRQGQQAKEQGITKTLKIALNLNNRERGYTTTATSTAHNNLNKNTSGNTSNNKNTSQKNFYISISQKTIINNNSNSSNNNLKRNSSKQQKENEKSNNIEQLFQQINQNSLGNHQGNAKFFSSEEHFPNQKIQKQEQNKQQQLLHLVPLNSPNVYSQQLFLQQEAAMQQPKPTLLKRPRTTSTRDKMAKIGLQKQQKNGNEVDSSHFIKYYQSLNGNINNANNNKDDINPNQKMKNTSNDDGDANEAFQQLKNCNSNQCFGDKEQFFSTNDNQNKAVENLKNSNFQLLLLLKNGQKHEQQQLLLLENNQQSKSIQQQSKQTSKSCHQSASASNKKKINQKLYNFPGISSKSLEALRKELAKNSQNGNAHQKQQPYLAFRNSQQQLDSQQQQYQFHRVLKTEESDFDNEEENDQEPKKHEAIQKLIKQHLEIKQQQPTFQKLETDKVRNMQKQQQASNLQCQQKKNFVSPKHLGNHIFPFNLQADQQKPADQTKKKGGMSNENVEKGASPWKQILSPQGREIVKNLIISQKPTLENSMVSNLNHIKESQCTTNRSHRMPKEEEDLQDQDFYFFDGKKKRVYRRHSADLNLFPRFQEILDFESAQQQQQLLQDQQEEEEKENIQDQERTLATAIQDLGENSEFFLEDLQQNDGDGGPSHFSLEKRFEKISQIKYQSTYSEQKQEDEEQQQYLSFLQQQKQISQNGSPSNILDYKNHNSCNNKNQKKENAIPYYSNNNNNNYYQQQQYRTEDSKQTGKENAFCGKDFGEGKKKKQKTLTKAEAKTKLSAINTTENILDLLLLNTQDLAELFEKEKQKQLYKQWQPNTTQTIKPPTTTTTAPPKIDTQEDQQFFEKMQEVLRKNNELIVSAKKHFNKNQKQK